jgi:hypothetical protein
MRGTAESEDRLWLYVMSVRMLSTMLPQKMFGQCLGGLRATTKTIKHIL